MRHGVAAIMVVFAVGNVQSAELTAIEVNETGTLKGKVTFLGERPAPVPLKIEPSDKDRNYCLSEKASEEDKTDPTWRVAADGAVANVVVWVRAPKGSFFKLVEQFRKPERETIKIDVPFCAFVPHVAVGFPNYFTDAKSVSQRTGQKFLIVNSSSIVQCPKYMPDDSLVNPSGNPLLDKGKSLEIPGPVSGERPNREARFVLDCTVRPWMRGYLWLFDHPFAAVTGKDGTFEFKVPAGSELELVYWHETFKKPKVLKKLKIEAGKKATENFQVSM